jgi:hypothetical protein
MQNVLRMAPPRACPRQNRIIFPSKVHYLDPMLPLANAGRVALSKSEADQRRPSCIANRGRRVAGRGCHLTSRPRIEARRMASLCGGLG